MCVFLKFPQKETWHTTSCVGSGVCGIVWVVVGGAGRGGVGALQVLLLLQYWKFKDSLETLDEQNVCSILHSQIITLLNNNTKLLKDLRLRKHRAFFYDYIVQNWEKKEKI